MLAQRHRQQSTINTDDVTASPKHFVSPQCILDAVHQQRQAKKDTKSLSQNLYDSVTLIYSYTKQIPTPASVFDLLHSPNDASVHVTDSQSKQHLDSRLDEETHEHGSEVDPTPFVNEQHVTREASAPTRIARQNSQQNLRVYSDPQSIPISTEVLDNGQRVHKIPYHPSGPASNGKMPKLHDSTSTGPSMDSPRLSISRTGKKNFTLGGVSTPPMRSVKSPFIAPDGESRPLKLSDRGSPAVLVYQHIDCDTLDDLKDGVRSHRDNQPVDLNFVVDFDPHHRSRPATSFVNRSLHYTLSDPITLLQSFHDPTENFKESPLSHLDSTHLAHSFRDWNRRNGALIFDSLWIAVEALFTRPPELDVRRSPRKEASSRSMSRECSVGKPHGSNNSKEPTSRYLTTHEAAHIVMICIHALTSLVPVGWAHTWAQLRNLRSWGIIIPNAVPKMDAFVHPFMDIIDELEYEPAFRLADRLLQGVGARMCFEHILHSMAQDDTSPSRAEHPMGSSLVDVVIKHLIVTEQIALARKQRMKPGRSAVEDPGWTVTATFLEWLRTIIIKKWDGGADIKKWSSVGVAVILFDKLRMFSQALQMVFG